MNLQKYIDHTVLRPEATLKDILKACDEARMNNFASVCVSSQYVRIVSCELKKTGVKTCVVVGFPLGSNTTKCKAFETSEAIKNGASEVDMVINIGLLKAGYYDRVLEDIKAVVQAAKGRLVKVIIETCLLSEDEIIKACELIIEAKAHFVKTSTGFSKNGATVENIQLLKRIVGDKIQIKASGGISTYEKAIAMINAGADRIGSSCSVTIMKESIL